MQPMIATLMLVAAPATVQQLPDTEREIVVTGRRLADTRKALDDCLARRCPPRADISATLAHTENLFVAGDYRAAQQVVAAGIRRNKRLGQELPREVAGLLRAHARLSGHLGEATLQRSSTLDVVSVLKSGLPESGPDIQVARIELADVFAKQGAPEIAEANYRQIEADARATGNRQIEGYARFRRGVTLLALSESDGAYRSRAAQVLQSIVDSPVAEHAVFADGARLGLIRLAKRANDENTAERLLASATARTPTTRPKLLYGEPIRYINARTRTDGGSVMMRMATDDVRDQWIDVTFVIDRNGLPQDIETVRTSDRFAGNWDKPVLEAIRTRRYAPLAMAAGEAGLIRVERYTKTAERVSNTGSRMREQSVVSTIEMTDLSEEPATPLDTRTGGTGTPAA